jgi:hypothetical protein
LVLARVRSTRTLRSVSRLVLYLNSITLVITGAPNQCGDRLLMDFCVELARAASVVADEMNLKLHPVPRKLWDESHPHGH